MGGDTPVTRREFKAYEKWQIRAERWRDRALRLQAKEYERRLGDLNHEAQRLAKFVETTVSETAFGDYKTLLDERVNALRRAEDQRSGGMLVLRILAGSGAVGLLLSILNAVGARFGG